MKGAPNSPFVTVSGKALGTPVYMPPEQARGHVDDIGATADVYAVGATMYQLLAGRAPYTEPGDRMSPWAVVAMVASGPPGPLSHVAPAAPPELVAIVEKAMARDILDRYPDMMALAHDLRAYLENRVVAAHESGAWAEAKKWVQRNKALATTMAAAFAAVLTLAVWATKERDAAIDARNLADRRAERLLRLSDARLLDDLLGDAEAIWPARPDMLEELESWEKRALELLSRQEAHDRTLADLRVRGTPRFHPLELEVEAQRRQLTRLARLTQTSGDLETRSSLKAETASLESTLRATERRLTLQHEVEFEDSDDQWWHDAQRDLLIGLAALADGEPKEPSLAWVADRLEIARTMERRSVTAFETEWKRTLQRLSRDGAITAPLSRTSGFVPIGRDPESGLTEFWHVGTGERPTRVEDGTLRVQASSGLVFVLVPHPLEPFLISKYEMTRAQWKRLTERAADPYPGEDMTPVDGLSWNDAAMSLRRARLEMPTASEWIHVRERNHIRKYGVVGLDDEMAEWCRPDPTDGPNWSLLRPIRGPRKAMLPSTHAGTAVGIRPASRLRIDPTSLAAKLDALLSKWHENRIGAVGTRGKEVTAASERAVRAYAYRHFDGLLDLLKHGDDRERSIAVAAVGFSRLEAPEDKALRTDFLRVWPARHPRAVGPLTELLVSDGPDVNQVQNALLGLAQLADPATPIAPVLRMLKHESPGVRANAGLVLKETLTPLAAASAVPALLEALDDSDPKVRLHAVGALGVAREPATSEAIGRLLHDRFLLIQAAAARALGDVGELSSGGPLVARLAEGPGESVSARSQVLKREVFDALHKVAGFSEPVVFSVEDWQDWWERVNSKLPTDE